MTAKTGWTSTPIDPGAKLVHAFSSVTDDDKIGIFRVEGTCDLVLAWWCPTHQEWEGPLETTRLSKSLMAELVKVVEVVDG